MEGLSPARVLVCLLLFLAGWAVFEFHPPSARPARPAPVHRAPAEHRYALDGTFYMVRYAAVRTPKGTYGFEPGREMHLLKACPDKGTVQVTDGRQTMEIDPLFLTRDLDVADAVRLADEAAQADLLNDRERQREAYETAHRPIYIAHAQDVYAAELERVRGSAIGAVSNPLSQPATPVDPYDVPLAAPVLGNTADLDPALASFMNQSAFGRLPSAER